MVNAGKLFAVDLASGERDPLVGGLLLPESVVVDFVNGRALLGEDRRDEPGILALDLSAAPPGIEPVVAIPLPLSIDFDPQNTNRALVLSGNKGLYEVNIAEKTKAKVVDVADLSGPYAAIFYPGDSNRVLVGNGSDALLEVNLGDDSKTLLSGLDASDGSRVGLGPTFRQIQSVILDPADSDRVYVHDGDGGSSGSGRIFSVDLATGDRIALEGSLGGGPEFISPVKVAFMHGASPDHPPMAIVLDSAASDSFYGVSLAAGDNLGDRVALSGVDADSPNQPLGSGVDFENPRDLVVDVANNRL